jgi:FKBP-type peptidyl-prolyl cis-trans isomerase
LFAFGILGWHTRKYDGTNSIGQFPTLPPCMNTKSLLLTGLLIFTASSALQAQEVKFNVPGAAEEPAAAAETTPAALAPKVTETEIMETFGWFMTARLGLAELRFTDKQIEAFLRGVGQAARGQETSHDLKTVGPIMDEFIAERQNAALERSRQSNLVAGARFFEALKKRPGIMSTKSGLFYEILQDSEGPKPTIDDTVVINFTGMLLNGQVFDSSEQQGGAVALPLASAMVGWAEGIQKIGQGGKIKLYIPSELAFGDDPAGGIPPGSSLIFEVELLDINPELTEPTE